MKNKKVIIESWPIAKLTRNARQDENFDPVSDLEVKALMDVMSKGRYDPVEATPDGEIIDGHQRVRAANRLGWSEIRVRVRHDLAGDDAAIELRHLQANFIRRQLHPLDRARCARRILELKNKREPGGLTRDEEYALAREVALLIHRSRKHALRLIRITNMPMEIQAAVKSGDLRMLDAEPIATLDREVQEEIADEIRDGGRPRDVIRKYLPTKSVEADPNKAFERLIATTERELDLIEGREKEIKIGNLEHEVAVVERLAGFGKKVIPILRAKKAEAMRAIENIKKLTGKAPRRPRTDH